MEAVFESDPELFLLRIWAEPRTMPGAEAVYRGRAEHASTGRRRYVKNLTEFEAFVHECLEAVDFPTGAFEGGQPDG